MAPVSVIGATSARHHVPERHQLLGAVEIPDPLVASFREMVLTQVKAAIDKVGYRGFPPIETLGAGDPREKVAKFFAQVRSVFAN